LSSLATVMIRESPSWTLSLSIGRHVCGFAGAPLTFCVVLRVQGGYKFRFFGVFLVSCRAVESLCRVQGIGCWAQDMYVFLYV